jgi:hypothetical protein
MSELSKEEISRFYDEVSRNLNHYTWLHIEVIEIIIPEYENYNNEYVPIGNVFSPCFNFNGDFIVKESKYDENIIFQILNDFVKDGLLWILARKEFEPTFFSVTERGRNCFKRIVKLFKETKV